MSESQANPVLPPSLFRAGEPVLTGAVLSTLVDEIRDLFRELAQWRAYGAAVQRVQTWPGYDDLAGAIEAEFTVELRRRAGEAKCAMVERRFDSADRDLDQDR